MNRIQMAGIPSAEPTSIITARLVAKEKLTEEVSKLFGAATNLSVIGRLGSTILLRCNKDSSHGPTVVQVDKFVKSLITMGICMEFMAGIRCESCKTDAIDAYKNLMYAPAVVTEYQSDLLKRRASISVSVSPVVPMRSESFDVAAPSPTAPAARFTGSPVEAASAFGMERMRSISIEDLVDAGFTQDGTKIMCPKAHKAMDVGDIALYNSTVLSTIKEEKSVLCKTCYCAALDEIAKKCCPHYSVTCVEPRFDFRIHCDYCEKNTVIHMGSSIGKRASALQDYQRIPAKLVICSCV